MLRKVLCSISYLLSGNQQFIGQQLDHSNTSRIQQLSSSIVSAWQQWPGLGWMAISRRAGANRNSRCSLLSLSQQLKTLQMFHSLALYFLLTPTNRAQLRNVRQTKQYMPVIHVLSRACFRQTVLHKSALAFHLCLPQQNTNTTDCPLHSWWLQLWPDPQFWKASPHALSCFWESATFEDAVGTLLQHFCSLKSFINAIN